MTIPNHLGIILDGNRRWAQEKRLPAAAGHKKGLDKVKETIRWCRKRGIKILTLFVFSTENWKRPQKEVSQLMGLFERALNQILKEKSLQDLRKEGIRIRTIGNLENLAESLRKKTEQLERSTEDNDGMILNFALSYGGRAEIVEALKKIIEKKIPPEKISEETIKENLWTSDVDLLIRTGKEKRISNFLIWQTAYSELYFSEKYWPDFSEEDLDKAIAAYSDRQRRFGA